jgi:pyruvate,water dikinase
MKKILQGMGVSKGKVQGRVKIIRNLDDHIKFEERDILVTRLTDPTMVILMGKASGIICDIGGLTSHPSIVSREMGIPCIVSAKCIKTEKNATDILKDGMFIEMCGESGNVGLIKKKSL